MVILLDFIVSKWVAISMALLVLLTIWVRSKFSYWKNKNVPSLQPSFPWGNLENLFVVRKSVGQIFWDFYVKMKEQGVKYAGFYLSISPVFVPIDPEIIKNILIKDFPSFHQRGFYSNEKHQPMSANIFTVDGTKWRTIRYKFSPAFSSGKIKYMYQLVVDCVDPLFGMVSNFAKKKQPISVKDVISRYTTDTIGSCAFGIDCNSFTESPTLYKTINKCIQETSKFVRIAALNAFPRLFQFLGVGLFVNKSTEYFASVLADSFEQRKKNLVYRTDFLQLMKDIQEKKNNEDFDLSLEEIQAQSFLFFLAGYETSSTAMLYLFLELAENVDIQERLRKEIVEVSEKHDGVISYEALQEMKFLQCVVDETLRKYPPFTVLNRTCTEDYPLPNGEMLDKGTNIIVPILAFHRDPDYYPNPDEFNPDRFSEENKANRHPYTYLPFGDGPRNCIGSRFAMVQIKVAVSHLVRKFRFTLNKNMDTTRRYTSHFILTLSQDILLDVEEI